MPPTADYGDHGEVYKALQELSPAHAQLAYDIDNCCHPDYCEGMGIASQVVVLCKRLADNEKGAEAELVKTVIDLRNRAALSELDAALLIARSKRILLCIPAARKLDNHGC